MNPQSNITTKRRVKFTFSPIEHQCFEALTKKKGFYNFVHNELHRFSKRHEELAENIAGDKKKINTQHLIPAELEEYYDKVSAAMGMDMGTFIMRYILLPHLLSDGSIFTQMKRKKPVAMPKQQAGRPACPVGRRTAGKAA